MTRLLAFICVVTCFTCPAPSRASVTFLGKAEVSATAADFSGLTDKLEDGTPDNRLGGFGSAIDYTGSGTLYITAPDRGPADGTTSFKCRIEIMDIRAVKSGTNWRVTATPKSTILLKNTKGTQYIGITSAFTGARRLDPEGIRVSPTGSFYLSDEYGPYVLEFDRRGHQVREIRVPAKFRISNPNADPDKELRSNKSGRQPNRGMEGLALSPDKRYLFGIMQSPLIQDGGINAAGKRIGTNIRLVRLDLKGGPSKEYVYTLDSKSNGVNEILAISDHEFLAIERDGKQGGKARFKTIQRIDVSGATDVSAIASLPSEGLPAGVVAAKKSLFIDMLRPAYGLAGATFPEKIEGLTFGPNLPDGRRLLIITSDNDFIPGNPSIVYAFAVDKADMSPAK